MKYILYVLSIAIITMILMYIGYLKEARLPSELINVLYIKARKKILDYLNKNKKASIMELQDVIKNIKGRVFWSKKQVKINEPEKFVDLIINDLYQKGLIDIEFKGSKKIICIKD